MKSCQTCNKHTHCLTHRRLTQVTQSVAHDPEAALRELEEKIARWCLSYQEGGTQRISQDEREILLEGGDIS
jgi:hypothetical protein